MNDDGLNIDVELIVANLSQSAQVGTGDMLAATWAAGQGQSNTHVIDHSAYSNSTSTDSQVAQNSTDITSLKSSRTTDETNIAAAQTAITSIQGDARWTNARTPTAHASTHIGGSDPIQIANTVLTGLCPILDGATIGIVASKLSVLAVAWSALQSVPSSFTPSAHAATHASNGSDPVTIASTQVTGLGTAATANVPASGNASTSQVVIGTDTRLADARNPQAHESTHLVGGSDALPLASASAAGLCPIYDNSSIGLTNSKLSVLAVAWSLITSKPTLDQISAAVASINAGSQKVINLATPTATTDAANKSYVDAGDATNATAITALQSRATTDETNISTNSSAITTLQNAGYTQGMWSNSAIDGSQNRVYEDDFLGTTQFSTVTANSGGAGGDTGYVANNLTTYSFGTYWIQSGTSNVAGAGCLALRNVVIQDGSSIAFDIVFRIYLNQLSTSSGRFTAFMGLCTSYNADLTGTSYGFEYCDANSANWCFTMGNIAGGSPTRTDLGSSYAVSSVTAYTFRMQCSVSNWSTINLWINGTALTSITSGVPSVNGTGAMPVIKLVSSIGTGQKQMRVDYYRHKFTH